MKGQISFVEYLVSLLLFVGFSLYIYLQLTEFMPNYLLQIRSERLKIEAYQISELLVNDPGEPVNWDVSSSSTMRVGLSDQNFNKTNFISLAKVNKLNALCINYNDVKNWIDSDRQFSFFLIDKNSGTTLIDCKPATPSTPRINATINRLVAFSTNNNVGELIVQVW